MLRPAQQYVELPKTDFSSMYKTSAEEEGNVGEEDEAAAIESEEEFHVGHAGEAASLPGKTLSVGMVGARDGLR